ncbi:helix-turn-helix domain-containing protein [Jiangella endophytica]|uniref:hypothetical protein n=1 Tax=Jiangella endophytica TaxID=1623398 RepID=UPI0013001B56|nr:hypothetical protein [Jiangella endophytica]
MSVRDFAEHLGVAIRTVSKWENRGAGIALQPATQAILDVALQRATDDETARFEQLIDAGRRTPQSDPPGDVATAPEVLLPLIIDGRTVLMPLSPHGLGRAFVDFGAALTEPFADRARVASEDAEPTRTPLDGSSMDIDRRRVLGALSYGIAAATLWGRGQGATLNAGRRLQAGHVDSIRAALVGYRHLASDAAPATSAERLVAAVRRAQQGYQGAAYDAVAQMLPDMITAVDAHASESVRAQELRAQTYIVAAKLLRKAGEAQLAWISADRAAAAASVSESPAAQSAAAYQVVCAMLAMGDAARAEDLAMTFVERFASPRALRDPELLSHAGALWLVSSVIAARNGDRSASIERLALADELGTRLGLNANYGWTAFGPVNVAIHRLSAAKETGDPNEVLELGGAIDADALPAGLKGRRAEVHINMAWAHTQLRNDPAAVRHLQGVENVAPELLSFNRVGAGVIHDLLGREDKSRTPGLRALARRAGVA